MLNRQRIILTLCLLIIAIMKSVKIVREQAMTRKKFKFWKYVYPKSKGIRWTWTCRKCGKNLVLINDRLFFGCNCWVIKDGFGNEASKFCPICFQPTVEVVRPGKFQCSFCNKVVESL